MTWSKTSHVIKFTQANFDSATFLWMMSNIIPKTGNRVEKPVKNVLKPAGR